MDKTKLIGLTGPARCGKTTAARIIKDQFGWFEFAFADTIRDMLSVGMQWDRRTFNGYDKEKVDEMHQVSPRKAMQTLGDWGRAIHPDFWIRITADDILRHKARFEAKWPRSWPGVVISDIRFENEAEFVRAAGGIVLHIHREKTAPVRSHISEQGIQLRSGDFSVPNNGTIEDLTKRLGDITGNLAMRCAS
jgi:hypothetical protein